jgi:hypothetical protein
MTKAMRSICDGGCGREVPDPNAVLGWLRLTGTMTRSVPAQSGGSTVDKLEESDFCSPECITKAFDRGRASRGLPALVLPGPVAPVVEEAPAKTAWSNLREDG